MDLDQLERFLLAARERTSLGKGHRMPPERPGAVEIVFREGGLTYRDSYFGQGQLIGQEVVRRAGLVVWAMNYVIVLSPAAIVEGELASFLQRAQLSHYRSRRLLGPYHFEERDLRYEDHTEGGLDLFQGETVVIQREQPLFRMSYCGGLVR
jgi:hypothetical protein